MGARPRALICLNPGAAAGRAGGRLRTALARAGAAGSHPVVEVRSVDDVGAALGPSHGDVVPVAAGGDGTVGMVATALRELGRAATPIAILPLGTANILAGELGITSVRRGLEALGGSRVVQVDVMTTSHPDAPLALVAISAGFEAVFIERYAHMRARSRAAGILAGLAGRPTPLTDARVVLDGTPVLEPEERVFSAGLYNVGRYAARVLMYPEADLSDGRGDAAIYRSGSAYLLTVASAVVGRRARPTRGVELRRWRSARLETPGPLQIDGESVHGGEITVALEPGALRVRIPALR